MSVRVCLGLVESGSLHAWLDTLTTLNGLVSQAEFWLWFALVALILEILSAGFFIAALAPAAVLTSAAAWLGAGVVLQLVVFSITSILSLMLLRPLMLRLMSPGRQQTNVGSLLGQTATVTDTVPAGGTGRVRLSNEEWRATSDTPLSVGDVVRVVGIQGNTLRVARA